MGSRNLADTPPPARRRPAQARPPVPRDAHAPTARALLVESWPGRIFLVAIAVKVVVALARLAGDPPLLIRLLSTAATTGLAFAVLFFGTRLVFLVQRQLLWRVRRKLILSYIFIGFVPALLIVAFFVLAGMSLSLFVGAYMFRNGLQDVERNVQLLAEAAATEITRSPTTAIETIDRVQRNGVSTLGYAALSVALVPAPKTATTTVERGAWQHLQPSGTVPAIPEWLRDREAGYTGVVAARSADGAEEPELIVRAVRVVGTAARPAGWVVVDVPMDLALKVRLHDKTGVRPTSVTVFDSEATALAAVAGPDTGMSTRGLFGRSIANFRTVDWGTGSPQSTSVGLSFQLRDLYKRLSEATAFYVNNQFTFGEAMGVVLVVVAVLFLIIEIVALVMGLALARSITSAVHELFMGTERVRQGDFTHRIEVGAKDQLGELADSFNQMTGSIENLLQTAAEKKRLEEELRIARQIQMSLLPRGPIDVEGLGITALCVPAREVGGDYYDFFPLGNERLGVLIADVAGKGTSAALYMAELKGLVLSLSQIYHSPRQLLIEVNRLVSDHLDSRSFITMTYAVIDLANRVMTYSRAGHTPLIFMKGHNDDAGPAPSAQVLIPSGIVLGLQIDNAAAKFNELLEEQQVLLHAGDVVVLYTDGISEAMNTSGDLFGDVRLSRLVEEHGHLESGELRERILREIEAFVGAADQHDDMTMILIKVEGAGVAARVAV